MSDPKALNGLLEDSKTVDNMLFCEDLREEAKEWIKVLNDALEKASEKQVEGYYNNVELEVGGTTYEASAFADDEIKPVIKFIKQFFNLEQEK